MTIREPRNHFELVDAQAYRFVAGGIGVTPILPMIDEVRRRGGDWRLLYGARSRASMAFKARAAALGPRAQLVFDQEQGPPDLAAYIAQAPPGAAVYCCGPEGLIQAVEGLCEARTDLSLHLERFAPATAVDGEGSEGFVVELRRTGRTVSVPANGSILEALRAAGVPVPFSCETGVCGACETDVVGGIPEHRDSILSPQERKENKTMMICVGRAATKTLVLDL